MVTGNAWYFQKRQEVIARRGGKCRRCGGTNRLEFHHRNGTGLRGRGRGRNARILDLIRHPRAYELLCFECHVLAHPNGGFG